MGESKIEWTEHTWNPIRGCVKVSPGCKHCYAETFAERFRGVAGHAYEQGFDPRLGPEMLDVPLRRRKPTTYFVNSMSDLFGEFVPDAYIAAVFGVMAASSRHTFQVLTKRAERLPKWFRLADDKGVRYIGDAAEAFGSKLYVLDGRRSQWNDYDCKWPLANVWLGVSVEDKKYGIPRIEHLRNTPAAVRFLSIEPLLEALGTLDLTGIHWVIVGGESGRGSRPMHPEWVRSIRDQCVAAGVPFFFKQWGVYMPAIKEEHWQERPFPLFMGQYGGKSARVLDGRTWDELPLRAGSGVIKA